MRRLVVILFLFSIVALAENRKESIQDSYSLSDFHFTKNEGQLTSEVLYHCKLHVGDILFKDTQFTFDLFSSDDIDKFHDLRHNHLQDSDSSLIFNKHIYHMNFVNANKDNLVIALIISAFVGVAISYSDFYLFHFVLLIISESFFPKF